MNPIIPPDQAHATIVQACHAIYDFALRRGLIVPAKWCERCGGKSGIVGHHPDYARPVDVEWLCLACHAVVHHKPLLSEYHRQKIFSPESPDINGLTPRQQEVYDFFAEFTGEHGMPPTVREVSAAMNIKSPNGIMCHLNALVQKGRLDHTPNISRGFRIAKGRSSASGN
jgi:hypothetical protein